MYLSTFEFNNNRFATRKNKDLPYLFSNNYYLFCVTYIALHFLGLVVNILDKLCRKLAPKLIVLSVVISQRYLMITRNFTR